MLEVDGAMDDGALFSGVPGDEELSALVEAHLVWKVWEDNVVLHRHPTLATAAMGRMKRVDPRYSYVPSTSAFRRIWKSSASGVVENLVPQGTLCASWHFSEMESWEEVVR